MDPTCAFHDAPETVLMDIIAHQLHIRQNEALRSYGITARQAKMLLLISRLERENAGAAIHQRMIERACALKGPTVTVGLKYLERGGFIERSPSAADARCNVIRLKEKGRDILPVMRRCARDLADELTDGMTDCERAAFQKTLTAMAHRLISCK